MMEVIVKKCQREDNITVTCWREKVSSAGFVSAFMETPMNRSMSESVPPNERIMVRRDAPSGWSIQWNQVD